MPNALAQPEQTNSPSAISVARASAHCATQDVGHSYNLIGDSLALHHPANICVCDSGGGIHSLTVQQTLAIAHEIEVHSLVRILRGIARAEELGLLTADEQAAWGDAKVGLAWLLDVAHG